MADSHLRAKNSLALISQASQERDDVPSTLRVKTRCGLVEEKQDFGLNGTFSGLTYNGDSNIYLCREFDTNGCSLPEFHAERSDDCIPFIPQPTHMKTFIDALY